MRDKKQPAKKAALIIMPEQAQDEPPKSGRSTHLSDELITALCNDLEIGATDKDVCEAHGVAVNTFYFWYRIGKSIEEGTPNRNIPNKEATRELYLKFFQSITRARAKARLGAITVVRAGFYDREEVTTSTETFSETRLKPNGEPYQYTETRTKVSTRVIPGDWRAGMEYLARRDKEHWSNRQEIAAVNIEVEAARRVAAGELDYQSFMELFADADLAMRVWALAGVELPAEAGQ